MSEWKTLKEIWDEHGACKVIMDCGDIYDLIVMGKQRALLEREGIEMSFWADTFKWQKYEPPKKKREVELVLWLRLRSNIGETLATYLTKDEKPMTLGWHKTNHVIKVEVSE